MEAKTLEAIQALTLTANDRLLIDGAPDFIMLPPGYSLHSFEKFRSNRRRFTGNFTTDSPQDFIAYVRQEYDAESSVLFIEPYEVKAHCILDLGNKLCPLHAHHEASFTPHLSALYQALKYINGKALSQRDAVDFVSDWRPRGIVDAADDTGLDRYVEPDAVLDAIRTVKIEERKEGESNVKELGHVESSFASLDASNSGKLPTEVYWSDVELVVGLKPRIIKMGVRVLVREKTPQIVFRIRGLELLEESFGTELQQLIASAGLQDMRVFRGNFKPGDYLQV